VSDALGRHRVKVRDKSPAVSGQKAGTGRNGHIWTDVQSASGRAAGHAARMFWVTLGWVLVVLGAATAIVPVQRARRRGTSGAEGLAIGCGGGLALWGAVVVIVGAVLERP